ncbi:CBS domain-containing protein [Natronomonas sp. EA1]|uniref:CBS domain-containing protein n=1 Tax=Natronomonas sp. EA1 TaxID=3421655 RepID=UPI003EBC8A86
MLVPLSVADLMSTTVRTVTPTATVREAAAQFREANVGSLVVVDDGPVGIITEADIVRLVAEGAALDDTTVGDVMTTELVTVGPEATLAHAAELLTTHDIRRLPVVDDDGLVGILTSSDLATYLPHLSERERERGERERASPEMDDADWEFEHEGEDVLSVGDVFRFRKTVSLEDVRAFAQASGDTNRLHLDSEFATNTRFGGPIVHGILTTGLISAALARLPGLTIYLAQDLRFLGPIRAGQRVTAVCEVTEALGGGKYEVATAVYNEAGERVIDGEAVVLMDELPAGETSAVTTAE